ncbi:MAG: nuclear transport factor 2 family protein [Saprospiraceae bacterium]|nr:nuclear transport factor 2 family protein [Saprospiraceae bacterium]
MILYLFRGFGILKYIIPVILVFCTGCHKSLTEGNDFSSTRAEVLQLHKNKFEWMVQKDTTALSELLDEKVSYIHSNGWQETKNEVLQNIVSGKLTYQKIDIQSASCIVRGSTAIVNGKGVFYVALDNKPIEINLFYTEVYHKQKNKWKLLARHACKI